MEPLPLGDVSRAIRQQLEDWQRAGLTHVPRVCITAQPPASRDSINESLPKPESAPDSNRESRSNSSTIAVSQALSGSSPPSSLATAAATRINREERIQRLTVLNDKVKQCQRCSELASNRTQTVFGVGNPEAKIVFIGEAPGADEDAQGEPFVGRAGQLLNKIIEACKLKREDVYICNILKCRPPGNRTPAPEECSNCREYLLGQLSAIDPDYIVCWGSVAGQNLLSMDWTIGRMRKRIYQFGRAKVVCTYHPSYLLRNPAAKKDVWDDMKFLFADMGVTLTP